MFHKLPVSLAFLFLCACNLAHESDKERDLKEKGQRAFEECKATDCEKLSLLFVALDNYGQLAGLEHVKKLYLPRSHFNDLSEIEVMTWLEELSVQSGQVQDLSPLEGLTNLKALTIWASEARGYSQLKALVGLKDLYINDADFRDLGFARHLTELRDLQISSSTTLDLSPLANHPSLETLSFTGSELVSIEPLISAPNLSEVTLDQWSMRGTTERQLSKLKAKGVRILVVEPPSPPFEE